MYKVFIADDDPAIVRGLMNIIDWEEYGLDTPETACNGLEAWKLIESSTPDILITDIKMPYMNGLELISRVKQIKPYTHFIVLSGYDDFEYLKKSIKLGIENYILKPVNVEELSSTLVNVLEKLQNSRLCPTHFERDKDIIRNNVLYRLVAGSISEEELNERLLHLNIKLNGPYTVCVFRAIESKTGQTVSGEIMSGVEKVCSRIIEKHGLGLTFRSPEGGTLLLICSNKEPLESIMLRDVLHECMMEVKNSYCINLFITVGSYENNWRLLEKSYKKAMELQQYSIILPLDSILDSEIEKDICEIEIKEILSFNEMIRFIASKDIEGLLSYIDGIFGRIANMKGITPHFVQNTSVEILFSIINIVMNTPEGSNVLDQEFNKPVSDIFNLQSLEDIVVFTKDKAKRIVQHLFYKQENLHPIIKRAMEHIKINYSKDISLKCMAHDFNINANYLGRLFKEELGVYFTDYVNTIRVEKAKELLLTTNKSTREISMEVGYSDPNYFYSLFKKYTGISPSEFKNQ
ncbi:response regulator transcription factor [Pseudobacteroides cellulosolvens]|uniref:Stage 0 sporulation protein A homolog n=1 Tax=Pseudobacteroides cellulosolvens ATCC 35603 = DSM 2933 TaxID=398512 RepID=A0A0L6JIU6_9FIRM|nr:response regulator transcription factor [Pseudobacteroides cellulosolvens]KNY25660.1 two component transcriptional regulator, AraC family [Pseudobacteroides cellulosolvens ATCC 35603 = DSM 2933]